MENYDVSGRNPKSQITNIPREMNGRDNKSDTGRNTKPLRSTIHDNGNLTTSDYDKLSRNRPNVDQTSPNRNRHYSGLHESHNVTPDKSRHMEMGVKNLAYQQGERTESMTSRNGEYDNPRVQQTSNGTSNTPTSNLGIEVKGASLNDIKNPSYSEYSSISDVMSPYILPNGPNYEFVDSKTRNRKKQNHTYEPASLPPKYLQKPSYKKYKKENYCKYVLLIFLGLVAIAALVLVILLMLGVINAKQCNDCGGNTMLIAKLQSDLEKQQDLIVEMTKWLEQQTLSVGALNTSVQNISRIPHGPRGFNGTTGPPGPPGPPSVFNISLCEFKSVTTTGQEDVKSWEKKTQDTFNVNHSCGFKNAIGVTMEKVNQQYYCNCKGADKDSEIDCFIHFWSCPNP